MDIEEAIQKINSHDQAAIIARYDGSVADVVEINTRDTENCLTELNNISESYKECAFHIYDRGHLGEISREQLQAIVRDIVECIEYGKQHGLKPGANIIR